MLENWYFHGNKCSAVSGTWDERCLNRKHAKSLVGRARTTEGIGFWAQPASESREALPAPEGKATQ